MTPEIMFAQALSKPTTEKEKIASVVQQMSVDELADFLRADVEHVTRRREWREADAPEMLGHEKVALAVTEEGHKADPYEMADRWGRELAHQHMEKVALTLPMGALQKGVGTAARKVLTTGAGTRMAVGAGVGAAGGAVKHMASNDPNSSLLGNMAAGAGIGAAAGYGAKAGVQMLGRSNTAAGKYITRGVAGTAREAKDAAGLLAAQNLAKQRKAGMLAAKAGGGEAGAKAAKEHMQTATFGKQRMGPVAPNAAAAETAASKAAPKITNPTQAATAPAATAPAAPKITNPTAGPSPILDASGRPFGATGTNAPVKLILPGQ